jgi:hypothetical protein
MMIRNVKSNPWFLKAASTVFIWSMPANAAEFLLQSGLVNGMTIEFEKCSRSLRKESDGWVIH